MKTLVTVLITIFCYGILAKSENTENILDPVSKSILNATAVLSQLDQALAFCEGVDIRELSIAEAQAAFKNKTFSSTTLTQCYINRINTMNPYIRVVIEVNPDAISIAQKLDRERLLRKDRGPLHGIPILVKDNMATKDKMQTCSGAIALVGRKPDKDSVVVAKLRKAGAVILGKTNLNEFAGVRGTNVPDGWSGRGGLASSVYNLNTNPTGSSTGSVSAVAANLCMAALGSETDGSVVQPTSRQGVAGIKPTIGLVSQKGIIPISFTQDSAGPITRTVQDLRIVLNAISDKPKRDKDGKDDVNDGVPCGLKKAPSTRIGVLRDPYWIVKPDYLLPQYENTLTVLKAAGFQVVDPVTSSSPLPDNDKEFTILRHEFKWGVDEYLKTYTRGRNKVTTLKDIVEYNIKFPDPNGYNQEILIQSEATDGIQNETYISFREENLATATTYIDSILKQFNLDAIIAPTESQRDVTDKYLPNFPTVQFDLFSVAAIARYPIISIPAGVDHDDVPIGISLTAGAGSDELLLSIAETLESALGPRPLPQFKN